MRVLKHIEVIAGDARFVAAATLEAGGRSLTAPHIFLNVSGRSVRPDRSGIDSVSIIELDQGPEHLVIVGGSDIGLAFAQMMRRFGAEVTVVERSSQLLPREDKDVSAGIRSILATEGVRFAMGSECLSLSRDGQRITVGDCNGRGAFTHTSWNDHEIVVANLFNNHPRRFTDRIPCYALFIDPALGRIGSFGEALDQVRRRQPSPWQTPDCRAGASFTL